MKTYLTKTLSATAFFSAVLVLSACSSKTRTLTVGDPAAVQAAEDRAKEAAEDAEAAEMRAEAAETALTDLRASLAMVQNALGQDNSTEEQRTEARGAVNAAQQRLEKVQQNLEMLPNSAAKTAADTALEAVDDALDAVSEALGAANAAFGPGGTISFVSMHTSLDQAQTALDEAQTKLQEALDADPDASLRTLLAQAQGTLTTAQVSLLPLLREELETARTERDEARTRADNEKERADTAEGERDEAQARADSEKERADTAEGERDEAQARADSEKERADTAEGERDEAQARADSEKERADTYDPRVPLTQALEPGAPRSVPRGEVEITRTPRDAETPLAIRTDAVAFAEGKRVGEGGGLAATDELPLRAVALRAAGRHPIKIQGDDGTPDAYGNTDGVVTSSLQLSADGATLKLGGTGVLYYDGQRRFDLGANKDEWWRTGPDGKVGDAAASAGDTMTDAHAADLGLDAASGSLTAEQATMLQGWATDRPDCWQQDLSLCGDWNHDDLAIAFGAPSQSPHGEPAYYWKVKVPLTETQLEQRLPWGQAPDASTYGRRPRELGTYELWLSNYGGLDTGADADDASDDTHRYLEYAAHGLFMFFDNVKALPSFTRVQAFAFGYDAFADADDMRTTDLSTSIAATFQGHTMARRLNNRDSITHITLDGALPIRGDITLNACIGGASCTGDGIPTTANRINGMISGLEELRHDGQWIPFLPAAGGIEMAEGEIAADGSFGGQLELPRIVTLEGEVGQPNSWNWDAEPNNPAHPSKYGGNLYGPENALEAAGWWHMQPDNRESHRRDYSSLIGSFGAKCTKGCVDD